MENDLADLTTQKLNSVREYNEAIGVLLRLAVRSIYIFDYSLEDSALDSPERYTELRNFLLRDRTNTLSIVVHDPAFLIRYCPRLQTLLRQFSQGVFIHQTGLEARKVYDPFIIVDTHYYLRRFHYESPRGIFSLDGKAVNESLKKRFQEIWETSAPALTATTLGL